MSVFISLTFEFLTNLLCRPNVPISSTSASPLSLPEPLVSYIPPHPQNGTPYHRYTILLLAQPDPGEKLSIPSIPSNDRAGFNLRQFIAQWGFKPESGGGAHFWRELWNPAVSDIYREHLREFHRYQRVIFVLNDGFFTRITRTTIRATAQGRQVRRSEEDPAIHLN
jgi:hypothetical protein